MYSSSFPKAPMFANMKFSFISSFRHFSVNRKLKTKDKKKINMWERQDRRVQCKSHWSGHPGGPGIMAGKNWDLLFFWWRPGLPSVPDSASRLGDHQSDLPENVCLGSWSLGPTQGQEGCPTQAFYVAEGQVPGLQAEFYCLHQQQLSAFLPLGSSKA